MTNISKVISNDRTTAYERWEMPILDDEPMLARFKERCVTAEPMQKQAYREGGRKAIVQKCQQFHAVLHQLHEPLGDLNDSLVQRRVE